jgi:hypothetical protein
MRFAGRRKQSRDCDTDLKMFGEPNLHRLCCGTFAMI